MTGRTYGLGGERSGGMQAVLAFGAAACVLGLVLGSWSIRGLALVGVVALAIGWPEVARTLSPTRRTTALELHGGGVELRAPRSRVHRLLLALTLADLAVVGVGVVALIGPGSVGGQVVTMAAVAAACAVLAWWGLARAWWHRGDLLVVRMTPAGLSYASLLGARAVACDWDDSTAADLDESWLPAVVVTHAREDFRIPLVGVDFPPDALAGFADHYARHPRDRGELATEAALTRWNALVRRAEGQFGPG